MAVNSYRDDEQLSHTSRKKILQRLLKYLLVYKGAVCGVLLIMAVTIGISLINPLLIEEALDHYVAESDMDGLVKLGAAALLMNIVFIILVKLRMYIMGMFCCTLFAYLFVKYWDRRGYTFYFFSAVVLVLGSLSHYYFLIYAFFTYGMIVLHDVFFRDFKRMIKVVLSCLAGAAVVLSVYPTIVGHILRSGEGAQSFENLLQFSDYFMRLYNFFDILNQDVFHGISMLLIMMAVGGFVVAYRNYEYLFLWRIGVLVIPTFCYFLIVAKVAPHLQDRYLCLIYPMVIIWVFVGVLKFIRQFTRNKLAVFNIILCGVIFLIIELSAYPHYKWDYTKKDFAIEVQPQIDKIKHYDCMAILDAEWKIWTLYPHLSQYSTITYMKTNQDFILDSKDYTQDGIVVYLLSEEDEEFLNRLLECFEQYDSYDLVFDSENIAFCNVYLLH